MNRLCIYPKDIQIITGKSDRYGRYLIKRIKEYFNKQQHQVVTVEEFCQYMGLQLEAVVCQLRQCKNLSSHFAYDKDKHTLHRTKYFLFFVLYLHLFQWVLLPSCCPNKYATSETLYRQGFTFQLNNLYRKVTLPLINFAIRFILSQSVFGTI